MSNSTLRIDYHSPDRRIGRLARYAPTPIFYLKLLKIIYRGARAGRRGAYTDLRWIQDSREVLSALESVGLQVMVENTGSFINLPSTCVFVSNHMSILETSLLPSLIRPYREVTFVIKQSLLTYPVFKDIMVSCRPIVVARENPRQDLETVLREGEKRLKASTSVIIFPQTTRSVSFDPEQFNSLGVKLARRAGVPIIPIALKTDAWGNGRLLKDFGRISPGMPVYFSFGEPITVTGNGRAAQESTIQFISGKLREWRVPVIR